MWRYIIMQQNDPLWSTALGVYCLVPLSIDPTGYHNIIRLYYIPEVASPPTKRFYPRKLVPWPFWPNSVYETSSAAGTRCGVILLTAPWFPDHKFKCKISCQVSSSVTDLTKSPVQFRKWPKWLSMSEFALSANSLLKVCALTSLKACACTGSW